MDEPYLLFPSYTLKRMPLAMLHLCSEVLILPYPFGMEMEKYMVRGVDGKWEKTGGKEEGETDWFIK